MKNVLLTGATGFIGTHFMAKFGTQYNIIPCTVRFDNVQDLNLQNIDIVVHTAGKAHDMQQLADKIYFDSNYELTKQLAQKAVENKVAQFVFLSTVKVFGEGDLDIVYGLDTPCNPQDAYGKSKYEAEKFLNSIKNDNFIVTIIRPPLVYGSGVKGNMIKILNMCKKDHVVPFKNIDNKRSMVFVDNLTALIDFSIKNKINKTLLAGDKELISTSLLLTNIKEAMGLKPKLFAVPTLMRKIIKKLKPALHKRLFGSFVINSAESNRSIQFVPPYSFKEGVKEMVQWHKNLSS